MPVRSTPTEVLAAEDLSSGAIAVVDLGDLGENVEAYMQVDAVVAQETQAQEVVEEAQEAAEQAEAEGHDPNAEAKKVAGVTANLGRSALTLSLGTFASRASGQARTILLVAAIGIVGSVADAFDIANTLPNMIFALLAAGVLQSILMPHIMNAIRADNAQERLDKLLSLAAVALLALTVLLVSITPLLIRVFTLAGDWSPQAKALAVAFGFWCIPQVMFYGLFSVIGELLNARGQFAATSWAPIANNVICVIGFGLFLLRYGRVDNAADLFAAWTPTQTALLAGTATLGIVAQAIVLLVALRRGGFHWHLRFGLHGIGLRSAGKVVGWALAAVVLEQVGLIYLRNITASAGQLAAEAGTIAAGPATFTNALTIYLLPHSLIILSIMAALYPRMALAAAGGDIDAVRGHMSLGLRSAGVFSVISSLALITLAEPVLKALLPALTGADVAAGAPVLRALAFGLVALGATAMVKRMYFAFEDGRSIFIIQVFATIAQVAVLWAASHFLEFRYWAIAGASAYALAAWVSVLLRVGGMRRKLHGLDGRRIGRLYVRAGIAGLAASAVGFAIASLMGAYRVAELTWTRAALICVLAGLAMLAVYVGGLKLLRVAELNAALDPLAHRFGRFLPSRS